MQTKEQRDAIINFFEAEKRLWYNKVIKSTRTSGDIAEFLCKKHFNIISNKSQIEVGHDGKDQNGKLLQIKINNSSTKTNQTIGNKEKYDFLYLLITKNSFLFHPKYMNSEVFIAIYKIPKEQLPNKRNIAKTELFQLKPIKFLDNHLNEVNIPEK